MDHYGTLTGATAYNEIAANGAAWLASEVTDAQRTAALIRASRSLDGMYGRRFPGHPTGGRAQSLAWPRINAIDFCVNEPLPTDEVPAEVERAAYAMALVELVTPGASSPNFTPGSVNKREKVDVIERERFGPNDGVPLSLDAQRMQMAEVEDALRCLLNNNGTMQCILRV